MSRDPSAMFSREELLGGLNARRASTLLFAIEARTAQLVGRSREAMQPFLAEKALADRERAFLNALAAQRDLTIQPSIQDLEHYAPQWATLVPSDSGVRAAIAHLMSDKYLFTFAAVASLRRALGLDDPAVQQAYERAYGQSLNVIFAPQITRRERLRWARAELAIRLDNLPPFWMAFALTLTESVGASILALPIALAGIGPIAALVALIVLGLVNILTIVAITESVVRNGSMRYGNAYFGRLVTEYLGNAASILLTPILLLLNFVALLVFYIGVSTALEDATRISSLFWAFLLFLTCLYFLRSDSISATVASALVVGGINITIILILSLLALPHIRVENLTYVNGAFLGRQPFDPSILGLVFGVILLSYFGHTSAGNCAKVVLRRDPTGRALIQGNMAAMATAIVLYCIWTIAVNGALDAASLEHMTGTALAPLAAKIGPVAYVIGLVYVILGMGMGAIHYSRGLFNQAREWLPTRAKSAPTQDETGMTRSERLGEFASSVEGRFWIGIIPLTAVFLAIEWLLLTKQESFTGSLGFLGVITAAALGGIFPMLLLAVSRRKGDLVPGLVIRFLGHPISVVGVYLLFLISIFLHGLVIWDNLLAQLAAVGVGIALLLVTGQLIRRNAFAPRAIVELRVDQNPTPRMVFAVTENGQAAQAKVRLAWPDSEQALTGSAGEVKEFAKLVSATFQLCNTKARDLKVWVHAISPGGDSEGLGVAVQVQTDASVESFDLDRSAGPKVLSIQGASCQVQIAFREQLLP